VSVRFSDGITMGDQTDVDGRFAFEGLPPGRCTVFAFERRTGARAGTWMELLPGTVSRVELRYEADDPVQLTGRVTRGGESLTGPCEVFLSRPPTDHVNVATDAGGRFALELRLPGTWRGVVYLRGEDGGTAGEVSHRFEVSVPADDALELALDLDDLPRVERAEARRWLRE
jgi:hypothetical protein